jgi:membrane-associated phospholipid phosphatase
MNFQDFLSSSIIIVYIIPIILYGVTHQPYHKIAFVGTLATNAISECIKHFLIREASPRPQGAMNCNIMCTNGNQEGKPGMPSSHAATIAFFTIYYIRHTSNFYLRALLISYAILVMMSRYHKRCHTVPQIIVGALLGGSMGILLK